MIFTTIHIFSQMSSIILNYFSLDFLHNIIYSNGMTENEPIFNKEDSFYKYDEYMKYVTKRLRKEIRYLGINNVANAMKLYNIPNPSFVNNFVHYDNYLSIKGISNLIKVVRCMRTGEWDKYFNISKKSS